MAKRLSANALESRQRATTDGRDRCRLCGGRVTIEDLCREDRYPKRRRCERCDAEYGTTRPAMLNY